MYAIGFLGILLLLAGLLPIRVLPGFLRGRPRHYVGYDTSPEYLQLAHKRLDAGPHPYDDG